MSISPLAWVAVGVIGAAGALLRVTVDSAVGRRSSQRLPIGTLVVNLSGALGLGLADGLGVSGNAALLIGAAGLGSYTTFSTLILETERLFEEGDVALALANLLGSMVLGLDAVVLGWVIGRAM